MKYILKTDRYLLSPEGQWYKKNKKEEPWSTHGYTITYSDVPLDVLVECVTMMHINYCMRTDAIYREVGSSIYDTDD